MAERELQSNPTQEKERTVAETAEIVLEWSSRRALEHMGESKGKASLEGEEDDPEVVVGAFIGRLRDDVLEGKSSSFVDELMHSRGLKLSELERWARDH